MALAGECRFCLATLFCPWDEINRAISGLRHGRIKGRVVLLWFSFSSRRRHTSCLSDWSSDVCSSDVDLGKAYTKAVRAFGEAGCSYLQLDEVFVAYLCDEAQREYLRGRGDDPDKLLHVYADLANAACAGRTPGMTITMHLCRGNFRSTWMAQGGYERVADVLFNQMGGDAYFMEYDTERAGGSEPLRFLPKNKQVVLGIMTSKTGALESKDQLKRRLEEASKFADIDQLCLSPQCGFASTEEGNLLAEDEQWAKLARCVEVAREVWD